MTLPGSQDETVTWIAEFRSDLALKELRELSTAAETASRKMEGVTKHTKQTEQAMDKGGKVAKTYARSIDAARIALGAIVAMGVFRVIQFIEESMRKATTTALEYEQSLFRLANTERILSQAGQEVTLEGLKQGIKDIKQELPIFSEADITQQVSLIGIMTKEMGIGEDKILDIAKAIGVLNIRSAESEDLLSTTNKVLTALVAPGGRGIASLGISFSEATIEAMAFKTGVLDASESFKDLSANEKDLLKIAILLENTGAELETINEFLDSNSGTLAQNSAAWEDLLRTVGDFLLPFVPTLTFAFENFRRGLIVVVATMSKVASGIGAIGIAITTAFTGGIRSVNDFKNVVIDAYNLMYEELIETFFPELRFQSETATNTSIAGIEGMGDAIQNISEIEGFSKLAEDLEKFQDKINEVNADFELKMSRMFEDFKLDQERLELDYQRKRADIIRDFNNRIAKKQQEHRQKETNEEAKFQERMRQLREKYLFDLEDALRARDAYQVLRLQRKYQMEKQNLINEHALRRREDDQAQQQEIADLAAQRDERLRQLAEEHRIRMQREREDYQIRKARAELDHQRDLEDIRRRIDERLMEFARAIGEEFDLNEQGVDALYQLLQRYYGPSGYFDGLYDYSYNSVVARGRNMIAQMNQIIASAQRMQIAVSQATATSSVIGTIGRKTGGFGGLKKLPTLGGMAAGGSFLATQPTHALFGEAGAELATFTPLSKIRGGGSPSGIGGVPGLGGELALSVILSPDLEARIVRTSLENVSATIESVQRER